MDTLLRRLVEWKARRKAAQVIVFDGGSEVERARAFLRGALTGIVLSAIIFVLTAPGLSDPHLIEEISHREALLEEANQRLSQALSVADVCLNTAQKMEQTLESYQAYLGGAFAPVPRRPGSLPAAP